MAIPVCKVEFSLNSAEGLPLENASILAQLSQSVVYQGVVVAEKVTGRTDADGKAVLELWPNALISSPSTYYKINIVSEGGEVVQNNIYVPDSDKADYTSLIQTIAPDNPNITPDINNKFIALTAELTKTQQEQAALSTTVEGVVQDVTKSASNKLLISKVDGSSTEIILPTGGGSGGSGGASQSDLSALETKVSSLQNEVDGVETKLEDSVKDVILSNNGLSMTISKNDGRSGTIDFPTGGGGTVDLTAIRNKITELEDTDTRDEAEIKRIDAVLTGSVKSVTQNRKNQIVVRQNDGTRLLIDPPSGGTLTLDDGTTDVAAVHKIDLKGMILEPVKDAKGADVTGETKLSTAVEFIKIDKSGRPTQFGGKANAVKVEAPLKVFDDPNVDLGVILGMDHEVTPPSYLAYLAHEEPVSISVVDDKIRKHHFGALWFDNVVVDQAKPFIEIDKANKKFGIQEADLGDPNVTGGTDYLIVFRINMRGTAPEDGYVQVYLASNHLIAAGSSVPLEYLKDVNQRDMFVQKHFYADQELGHIEVSGIVNAKGLQDFSCHVAKSFSADITITDRVEGVTGILIQPLLKNSKTSTAMLEYEADTGENFRFSSHYFGTKYRTFDYEVIGNNPVTGVGGQTTGEILRNYWLHAISSMDYRGANNKLDFMSSGNEITDFSFATFFSSDETHLLAGKRLTISAQVINRDNAVLVGFYQYTGIPDKYSKALFKSRAGGGTPDLDGWIEVGKDFLAENKTGVSNSARTYIVPAGANNLAVAVYPSSAENPTNITINHLDVDFQDPFSGYILADYSPFDKKYLEISGAKYGRFSSDVDGYYSLRYTIGTQTIGAPLPCGHKRFGNLPVTRDYSKNKIVGSQDRPIRGGEGALVFSEKGEVTMTTLIRLSSDQDPKITGDCDFWWIKKSGTDPIVQIPGSDFKAIIVGGTKDAIYTNRFTFTVEKDDYIYFRGRCDIPDGAFTMAVIHQPDMIRNDISFLPLAAGAAGSADVESVKQTMVSVAAQLNTLSDEIKDNDDELSDLTTRIEEVAKSGGGGGGGGTVGPQGRPGNDGTQGPAGVEGPEGPKGDAGAKGPQGPVGPKGDAGADGIPGVPGAKGDTGPAGAAGGKMFFKNINDPDSTWLSSASLQEGYDTLFMAVYPRWTQSPDAPPAISSSGWNEGKQIFVINKGTANLYINVGEARAKVTYDLLPNGFLKLIVQNDEWLQIGGGYFPVVNGGNGPDFAIIRRKDAEQIISPTTSGDGWTPMQNQLSGGPADLDSSKGALVQSFRSLESRAPSSVYIVYGKDTGGKSAAWVCYSNARTLAIDESSWEKLGGGGGTTVPVKGPKGDTGDTGPEGTQGPAGVEGPEGPKGDAGAEGPRGHRGPAGQKGDQGLRGETGAQGPQGETGNTGARGPKGDKGEIGDKGDLGPVGPVGPAGEADKSTTFKLRSLQRIVQNSTGGITQNTNKISGLTGRVETLEASGVKPAGGGTVVPVKGPKGDMGEQGPEGPEGPQGEQGPVGPAGAQGPKGNTGAQGSQGEDGQDGARGPAGPAGAQGLEGPQGVKGEDGDPGEDGSIGPAGATGRPGPRGEPGAQGVKGDRGYIGPIGSRGRDGDKGDRGDKGLKGKKGDTGPIGPRGKDGVPGAKGDTGPAGAVAPSGKTLYQTVSSPSPSWLSRVALPQDYDTLVLTVVLDLPSNETPPALPSQSWTEGKQIFVLNPGKEILYINVGSGRDKVQYEVGTNGFLKLIVQSNQWTAMGGGYLPVRSGGGGRGKGYGPDYALIARQTAQGTIHPIAMADGWTPMEERVSSGPADMDSSKGALVQSFRSYERTAPSSIYILYGKDTGGKSAAWVSYSKTNRQNLYSGSWERLGGGGGGSTTAGPFDPVPASSLPFPAANKPMYARTFVFEKLNPSSSETRGTKVVPMNSSSGITALHGENALYGKYYLIAKQVVYHLTNGDILYARRIQQETVDTRNNTMNIRDYAPTIRGTVAKYTIFIELLTEKWAS